MKIQSELKLCHATEVISALAKMFSHNRHFAPDLTGPAVFIKMDKKIKTTKETLTLKHGLIL